MSDRMQKFLYQVGGLLSFVLLVSSPLIAQDTVTFNLTGVGQDVGISSTAPQLGGVYTSPYYGDIETDDSPGPAIPVICDDFADNSFIPESWTAYVNPLSSILSGNTSTLKFSSGWNGIGSASSAVPTQLTQAQTYTAAAILAVDISNSTGLAQEEYSYALWELTEPQDASSALPSGDQAAVQSYLRTAVTDALGNNPLSYLNGDTVTFYSYDAPPNGMIPTCGGSPCASLPPQEFVTVSTPEPSSPALLGLDFLGLSGLVLVARRRLAKSMTR
jgi:hypothetical protein